MSGMIDSSYLTRMYSALPRNLTVQSKEASGSNFGDMAASAAGAAKSENETSKVDAYLEHLKKKYGRVTIESIGKDQASLEKAEQQRQYQEQAAAAAAQRRAMWEHTAETAAPEKTFSNIGDLLKTRTVSAPAITPEVFLPAGINMFFLDL